MDRRRPESLTETEHFRLKAVLVHCPELDTLTGRVRSCSSFKRRSREARGVHLQRPKAPRRAHPERHQSVAELEMAWLQHRPCPVLEPAQRRRPLTGRIVRRVRRRGCPGHPGRSTGSSRGSPGEAPGGRPCRRRRCPVSRTPAGHRLLRVAHTSVRNRVYSSRLISLLPLTSITSKITYPSPSATFSRLVSVLARRTAVTYWSLLSRCTRVAQQLQPVGLEESVQGAGAAVVGAELIGVEVAVGEPPVALPVQVAVVVGVQGGEGAFRFRGDDVGCGGAHGDDPLRSLGADERTIVMCRKTRCGADRSRVAPSGVATPPHPSVYVVVGAASGKPAAAQPRPRNGACGGAHRRLHFVRTACDSASGPALAR